MAVFKRKNRGGQEGETGYVDYRDPTGKRIIRAIGPKKREAEDYLGKMKGAIREERYFDIKKDTRVKFKKLLDDYVEKMKDQKYFKTSIKYFIPIIEGYFNCRRNMQGEQAIC